jgi:hypothetical protein
MIAPVGFFMGMPFPKGIIQLSGVASDLIPWVWGINGATSVVSSILAVLLALSFGFKWVLILGIAAYGGALLSQRGIQ